MALVKVTKAYAKASVTKSAELEMRKRAFRAEASRKAALANKRLKRIEENELKDSPAYQRFIKDGGQRFGVRGKTYNEVQAEVARLDRFIDAQTSTIRGINSNLKQMAEATGMKYKTIKELQKLAPKYFELASKVEQYLRNVEDMASAIGYQRIWEAINVYTAEQNIQLAEGEARLDEMIETISKYLVTQNRKLAHERTSKVAWYTPK